MDAGCGRGKIVAAHDLTKKLIERQAQVGIIGCGYVGLPLAVEFARKGFHVVGIDTDEGKIRDINCGVSYIQDIPTEVLREFVEKKLIRGTSDYSILKELDTVNICVPTPLGKTKDPDVSYIVSAVDHIAKNLHRGQLIVLESTTYPGTTEELILPELEKSGLKVGIDFFLAFSPERVDPGNPNFSLKRTPKVVGGVTAACTSMAKAYYEQIIDTVVPVSTTRVAETVKLLENTFRSVNIGLVNEIALMSHNMGIDVWEVIEAASTKPFGFMPFFPGPGLGGHCIPIDPFYLSWKAKQSGFECRFIELAGHVNGSMPEHVVGRIADGLNEHGKSIKNAKILILGVGYKRGVSDVRESPALDVMSLLCGKGAVLSYADPFVPQLELGSEAFEAVPIRRDYIRLLDAVVIITDHAEFDYGLVVDEAKLVIDTRNALKNYKSAKILRL